MEVSLNKNIKIMNNRHIFWWTIQEWIQIMNGDIKLRLQKVHLKFIFLFKIIIINTMIYSIIIMFWYYTSLFTSSWKETCDISEDNIIIMMYYRYDYYRICVNHIQHAFSYFHTINMMFVQNNEYILMIISQSNPIRHIPTLLDRY